MEQINQVVKFILYKSRQSNHPLTQVMAYFLGQIIYNHRTQRFFLEDRLTQSEIRQVKQLSLKKILSRDQPSMKTLLLQVAFNTSHFQIQSKKQQDSKVRSQQSAKLIDQVINLEVKSSKDFEGLTELYNKVFNYLLQKAKQLTNPQQLANNSTSINKQVAAALQSIIPRAALNPFATLNPTQKLNQLTQLSNLVLGIRLFNQQIQKGGSTLIPIRQLLQHPGRQLLRQIRKQTTQIIQFSQNYTTVFMLDLAQITSVGSPSEMSRYKDQLTFLRQYLNYVVSLQQDIQITQNSIDINQTRYKKQIQDLKILLGTKTSAPKEQVYPKFAALANSYIKLFEQKRVANSRIQLLNLLTDSRKQLAITLTRKIVNLAKSTLATAQSVNYQQVQFNYAMTGVDRLMPHQSPDFMQTPLDYLGFCLWSIVKKDGLLIPGKPNLGVYRYKDKSCVFSSQKGINQFLKNPDEYIQGVVHQCRLHPQLIYLLRMQDNFRGVDLNIISYLQQGAKVKSSMMVDKSTQTPVHFIQKNLDPNYCWNQWQLRKKAIQMANIRKRTTKACQTILSDYRTDSIIQTFLPKQTGSNTMKHYGFSAERFVVQAYKDDDQRQRPRVYIAGIRDKTRS